MLQEESQSEMYSHIQFGRIEHPPRGLLVVRSLMDDKTLKMAGVCEGCRSRGANEKVM